MSELARRIPEIQAALVEAELDGWLFAVFQSNDPVSLDLLGLAGKALVTRRCYYLVPSQGEPRKLVSTLEPAMLDHLPGEKAVYTTWREHRAQLEQLVRDCRRLAAQYSPKNELPSVSRLDAGTAELLGACGVELASAAELAQRFAAVWTAEQLAGHRRANVHLHRIVREAFDLVSGRLRRHTASCRYEASTGRMVKGRRRPSRYWSITVWNSMECSARCANSEASRSCPARAASAS